MARPASPDPGYVQGPNAQNLGVGSTAISYPNFQNTKFNPPDLTPLYQVVDSLIEKNKKEDITHQKAEAERLFSYAATEAQGNLETLRRLYQERGLDVGGNPAFIARSHEVYAEHLGNAYFADLLSGIPAAAEITDPDTGAMSQKGVTPPGQVFGKYAAETWQKYASDPILKSDYGSQALFAAKEEAEKRGLAEFSRQRIANQREFGANQIVNSFATEIRSFADGVDVGNPEAEGAFISRLEGIAANAHGFGALDVRGLAIKAAQDALLSANDPGAALHVIQLLKGAQMGVPLRGDATANHALDMLGVEVSIKMHQALERQDATRRFLDTQERLGFSSKFFGRLAEADHDGIPTTAIEKEMTDYMTERTGKVGTWARKPLEEEFDAMKEILRKGETAGSPGLYKSLLIRIHDGDNIDEILTDKNYWKQFSVSELKDLLKENDKKKNIDGILAGTTFSKRVNDLEKVALQATSGRTAEEGETRILARAAVDPIISGFKLAGRALAVDSDGRHKSTAEINDILNQDNTLNQVKEKVSSFLDDRSATKAKIENLVTRAQDAGATLAEARSKGLISREELNKYVARNVNDPTRYLSDGKTPDKRWDDFTREVRARLVDKSSFFAKFTVTPEIEQDASIRAYNYYVKALNEIRADSGIAVSAIPLNASIAKKDAIIKGVAEALQGVPSTEEPKK